MYNNHVYTYRRHKLVKAIKYLRSKDMIRPVLKMRYDLVDLRNFRGNLEDKWMNRRFN